MTFLAVLALLLALVALGFSVMALRRTIGARPHADASGEDLPTDVLGLRQEVAGLRLDLAHTLRNVSLVRYDAFGDMGGALSWSVALLDDQGDGLLLTSIHGRNDSRTYARSITNWESEQQLSPEEQDALRHARG